MYPACMYNFGELQKSPVVHGYESLPFDAIALFFGGIELSVLKKQVADMIAHVQDFIDCT